MNCRMCLQKSEFPLHIYGESSAKFPIASTIARHFWFVITEDDAFSTVICLCCWSKIENFHEYYVSVEEAQRSLSVGIIKTEDELIHCEKEPSNPCVPQENDDRKSEKKEDVEECLDNIESSEQDNASTSSIEKEAGDFLVDDDSKDADYKPENDFNSSDDEPLATIKSEIDNERHIRSNPNPQDIPATHENINQATTIKQVQSKKPKGKSRRVLNQKFEEIAQRITITCDMCTSTFATFTEMKHHCRAVHKVTGYTVCCSSKFHRRAKYLEHMIRHIAPEMLTCDKCGQLCASVRNLKDHNRAVHGTKNERPYQCDQCPNRYLKPFALKQHKKLSHDKSDARFKCDDCGKCFRASFLLRKHKHIVHEKSFLFVCEVCAKGFVNKTVFTQHRMQHDGLTKPRVQCDECGTWLKSKRILKEHKKLHKRTNENLFECDLCGKKAPTKKAIKDHIRYVHSEEKPYRCSYCDKAFKKPLTLKEHTATHTDEALYTCPYCPKTFNSRGCMHTHRKNKHPKEWQEDQKDRSTPRRGVRALL